MRIYKFYRFRKFPDRSINLVKVPLWYLVLQKNVWCLHSVVWEMHEQCDKSVLKYAVVGSIKLNTIVWYRLQYITTKCAALNIGFG
jgi:hypothetical protein